MTNLLKFECYNECAESQTLAGYERNNQRDNESGGNLEESSGKETEMVLACDEKGRRLCRRGDIEVQGKRKAEVEVVGQCVCFDLGKKGQSGKEGYA